MKDLPTKDFRYGNNIEYAIKIRKIVWDLTRILQEIRDVDVVSGNNMFLKQCEELLNLAEEMLKGEDE